MIYVLLVVISVVIIVFYLKQKRYNELFIRHLCKSDLIDDVTKDIYVNNLIKLYYDICNDYNIQILTDEEIIELKNNKSK